MKWQVLTFNHFLLHIPHHFKDKHCTNMKVSCKKRTPYLIFIYLCRLKWFGIRIQRRMINRESGVNPEQSRCCEALHIVLFNKLKRYHWHDAGKAK